jgi:hypothetical protein
VTPKIAVGQVSGVSQKARIHQYESRRTASNNDHDEVGASWAAALAWRVRFLLDFLRLTSEIHRKN